MRTIGASSYGEMDPELLRTAHGKRRGWSTHTSTDNNRTCWDTLRIAPVPYLMCLL